MELTRGSKPLALVSRTKRLAVFVFLALSRKSFQRRDILQAIFWPDSDQERARHSLNETLYLLRRELGPNVVVSRGADEIGIAPAGIWSDVNAFEELLAARDYAHALALYRGDLLPGFFLSDAPEFEHWLEEERARLRRAANEATCARAERAADEGNHSEAAEWARRAAAMAVDDEVLVRRSILLLGHIGDRAGAIETFERFRHHLMQKYDARPAPETERVIAEIRRRIEPSWTREPFESPRPGAVREPQPNLAQSSVPPPPAGQAATPKRKRPWIAPGIAAGLVVMSTACAVWLAKHNELQNGAAAQTERPGIIVSPFHNLGTIPELEYLGQAITAALTEQIAQVDAIELIADESYAAAGWTNARSSRLSGRAGREVFVVKGNVLSSRDRIRVSISLIDASSGTIARTATVERSTEEVFPLIEDVAKDLSELLRSELGHEIRLRRWRAATTNKRAWELQQRAEVERLRAKTFEEHGSFSAAMTKLAEADSLLALAQAEQPTWDAPTVWRARLASDAAWLSFLPPMNDTGQASRWIRTGLAYTDQVLQRDSAHGIALELRGTLRYWSSLMAPHAAAGAAADLRRAEADLRRAVSVDPTRARAWSLLSALLFSRGDFAGSYVAGQHAYAADAYLEARDETVVRLALAAYETGSDSIAWRWCSAVESKTVQGAYCRLSLLAWSNTPDTLPPVDPWLILAQLSDSTPVEKSMKAPLTMLVAHVLARQHHTDSARAVIRRVRQTQPQNRELDLFEAGARLTLGDRNTAVTLLHRHVLADSAHNAGVIASRRFAALRNHFQTSTLSRQVQ